MIFYIDHIMHNGVSYPYSYITQADILQGGSFTFYMASEPNKAFGESVASRPKSHNQ